MSSYQCKQPDGPIDAKVKLPGSKSISNRALIMAALADGTSIISNLLLADDTQLMIEALRSLGVAITVDESNCVAEVTGCHGQLPISEAELYCGNSGTTIRFCAAACATAHGKYRLDGSERMCQRPIGALGAALQALGAGVEYPDDEGYPPIVVHANGLLGGLFTFDSPESSQLISALLMASPYAQRDLFIEATGDVPSKPYLDMTVSLMDRFGVAVVQQTDQASKPAQALRFIIPAPQRYTATNIVVEPDASNASYFLAVPAIVGGQVIVPGLETDSIQGDAQFLFILEKMGCRVRQEANQLVVKGPPANEALVGVDVDLSDMPDTAQTLAVLALFARGRTRIRNVGNLRVKETDRLAALTCELTKLGASVTEGADSLDIEPPQILQPAEIDTYDDHRMAMSFALAGLACPGLIIRDSDCCKKTFPDYFSVLEKMVSG